MEETPRVKWEPRGIRAQAVGEEKGKTMMYWMLIFVSYLVPSLIGLPLILLWNWFNAKQRLSPTINKVNADIPWATIFGIKTDRKNEPNVCQSLSLAEYLDAEQTERGRLSARRRIQ
jgi:ABC-type uncharacterized transport system permease subunit